MQFLLHKTHKFVRTNRSPLHFAWVAVATETNLHLLQTGKNAKPSPTRGAAEQQLL